MPTALVTGASSGLGRALPLALARRHWHLVIDARGGDRLAAAAAALTTDTAVEAYPGSVTDPQHRADLVAAVRRAGGLDLLVHNASELGGSPQPALADLEAATFTQVFDTNVGAPVQLTRQLLPELASGGTVLAISSDTAVEHYGGWGAYGASKAALDHVIGTFAVEQQRLRWYAVDPGDMRTEMHQAAFPDEDITDRPWPESVVPALLRLLDERPPSGRYRGADLAAETTAAVHS